MAHYVRARLADNGGAPDAAAENYAALLTANPGDTAMALRAYRGGMAAGDQALALRAAYILEAQGALPAEGRLLLLSAALVRGDWRAAGLETDRLEQDGNFEFLAPILRAWLNLGARKGPTAALLEGRQTSTLTSAYAGEHRALLLIAGGKADQGIAILQSLSAPGTGLAAPASRIAAAAMLVRKGEREPALALLAGPGAALAEARATVAAKDKLAGQANSAAKGVSLLMIRLAEDIGGRQASALSVSLARIATFLDPASGAAWLVLADLLRGQGNIDAARIAVERVDARGPWQPQATDVRVALLASLGDNGAALAAAHAATTRAGAESGDFARLGDLLSGAGRHADAATAYRESIARSEAAGGTADWSSWLLLGGALKQADDWAGAKPALERALALAPDQPVVLNYLGYAQLERRENLAEAEALIQRANRISPDDASFIDSLGWAYHVRGETRRAIETLERAVNEQPGESIMNEHLGDAYWAAGRKIEARYAWQSALVTADDIARARLTAKSDLGWTAATAAP